MPENINFVLINVVQYNALKHNPNVNHDIKS